MNSEDNNLLLGGIIGRIAAFDRRCKAESYTDTEVAWDLLNSIKDDVRRILKPPKPPKPVKITSGKEAKIVCPKCGPVVPRLAEEGYTINHDLVSLNKKTGIEAHAWNGDSGEVSEEGNRLIFECRSCGSSWPVPEDMEVEWL